MVTFSASDSDVADHGAERAGEEVAGVEVLLIRHGQTRSYASDAALTELGERQSLEKGRALAGRLRPDAVVHIPHAPTARATRTAELLAAGLAEGVAERDLSGVRLGSPVVAEAFHNFRIACAGRVLDPTQAYPAYTEAREQLGERDPWPGWVVEMRRFFDIQDAGGDPITWWLTQPVQHFEPAASAVRRFWRGVLDTVADPATAGDSSSVFVCTHSGCIRAVAAAAVGFDPGEPENTEDVRIRVLPGHTHALLEYREHSVRLEIPVGSAPWTTR
jgi:broad specificity phosphatase PhoE